MQHPNSAGLVLDQFVPYRMVKLAHNMSLALARMYQQQFDINIAQWRILAQLAEQPSLLAKEIGVITAMDKSKVSRAVAVLKTKGYLNQCPDDHDNRATRLSLSLQGRKFYQNIAPKALAWEQQLMAALEPTEQQDLINILSKLDQRIGQLS
jgi:DNA-binding MarR family transcriptional regulator